MATASAVLQKNHLSRDNTYPLVIRMNHQRQQRFHPVGYKIQEKYWNGKEVVKHPDAAIINSLLAELLSQANHYFADCRRHGRTVDLKRVYASTRSYSFLEYLRHRAKQYAKRDSPEMDLKLRRFAKEMEDFQGGDVRFEMVTPDFLRDFENYLIALPNSPNTRAFKFGFLRRYYENAIDEGKAVGPNHFKTYKIKTTKVKIPKLTFEELAALEALQLRPGALQDTRNLFLFAYYCKGARFRNCIQMRWSDVRQGRIHFESVKNGTPISVLIHSKMQALLDQYDRSTEFIFPFVSSWPSTRTEQRGIVGSLNVVVNRNLKRLGELAGIEKEITFHMARHSLAFHLKQKQVSVHTIKDTLGHADTKTTEDYLEQLDDEYLDEKLESVYGK